MGTYHFVSETNKLSLVARKLKCLLKAFKHLSCKVNNNSYHLGYFHCFFNGHEVTTIPNTEQRICETFREKSYENI